MVSPVARFVSGAALPVDLSDDHIPGQGALVSEARQRISSALNQPYNLIRLVDPLRFDVIHDSETLAADVLIVVLTVVPVIYERTTTSIGITSPGVGT